MQVFSLLDFFTKFQVMVQHAPSHWIASTQQLYTQLLPVMNTFASFPLSSIEVAPAEFQQLLTVNPHLIEDHRDDDSAPFEDLVHEILLNGVYLPTEVLLKSSIHREILDARQLYAASVAEIGSLKAQFVSAKKERRVADAVEIKRKLRDTTRDQVRHGIFVT